MNYTVKTIILFVAVLVAPTLSAQITTEDAQQARDTRMAVFELLSFNMQPIAGIARRTTPFDGVLVEQSALRIAMLASMIPEMFEVDTRGAAVFTRAKDFIWDNNDTFLEHAADLERAALIVAEVGANNDAAAAVSAIRGMGQACGACHDLFRFQLSDPALPMAPQD